MSSSFDPGAASNGTSPPNGAGITPEQQQDPAAAESDRIATLEKQIKDLSEKYDARIKEQGQQLQRLKNYERVAPAAAANQSQQAPSAPLTHADLRAAMALERQMQGLPDAARQHLESLEEAGASPSEILREVKAIRLGMGAGVTPAEPVRATQTPSMTREWPATAPPRAAVQHPRTLGDYYELAKTNPELKKQLDRDPTFHPEELPHR